MSAGHVVEPFPIPDERPRFRGLDFGNNFARGWRSIRTARSAVFRECWQDGSGVLVSPRNPRPEEFRIKRVTECKVIYPPTFNLSARDLVCYRTSNAEGWWWLSVSMRMVRSGSGVLTGHR